MGIRRAARISGGGRRLTAWGAVVPFALFVVLGATSPGLASAATGAESSSASLPIQPAAVAPAFRALCPPAAPGHVTCFALVRTDASPMARAAVRPDSAPFGYSPSDLQSAYGLSTASASNGTGITVAVVDYSDLATAESDLAAYRSQYGLSPCTTANGCFKKVDEHGGTHYPEANSDWAGEIALDIEMVSAICPNCHILLVEASTTFVNDLGTAVNTAVSKGATVISNSYGGPDQAGEASWDSSYYNHPGIAITASTGDSGFGVQFPAASPHVTSVGGTSLSPAGNARGWTETAWAGAGSGCSGFEGKPAFQHDAGCSNRTVSDVSAVADTNTPVAMFVDGSWIEAGGTSVAAPIIAGVYALAGKPTAGSYPVSYPYAQTGQLNDVTSGSNGGCSPTYLCTAGAGYDGPTGLGTPNGIGAFTSPLLPAAPTVVTGTPGDSTVAVSWHAASGNGHPITGYAVTATPGGGSCTTSGALTCMVGGLTNGTSYTFRVTATNSVGTGPASAASAGVVPATVPDAPTGVAATPADSSAVVTWSPPGSNGGAPVSGYTVTSSPLGRICSTTGAQSCTVLGLANGTSYTFTVTATNAMGTGAPSAPSAGVTPVAIPGATYVPVTPERLVNSRNSTGVTTLIANHHQTFSFAGSDVPSSAVAVTGNLTVTNQSAAGYISLTSSPNDGPLTSTLNFPLGDNRANGVTVPLGSMSTLNFVYVAHAGATTDVVFDLTGYFVPDASGATYVPVTPERLVNSRNSTGVTTLIANHHQTFSFAGSDVPSSAVAVTGNLTVTNQSAAGYISLTSSPNDGPLTSTLNFPLGDNRANGVTVPLGSMSTLNFVYVAHAGATTDVVFDLTGYFVPDASGATYVPVTPNRIVDSRLHTGVSAALGSSNPASFLVTDQKLNVGDPTQNIPADAIAVTGNLTVTSQTGAGYFALTTVATSLPLTSTLNFPLGDNRANGVTVPLGTNGDPVSPEGLLWITYVARSTDTAHVVFDVTGYFVPPPG